MTYDEIYSLMGTAKSLHRMTKDSLMLSALTLMTDALHRATFEEDTPLTPMEDVAVRCVTRCETARRTLWQD